MDTSALATVVPAGGLGACLLLLISYLVKLWADSSARTAEADKRAADAHDRAELAQILVDEERAKRRDAEQRAAIAETRVAAQEAMIQWAAREREYLRRYGPSEAPPGVLPDPPEPEEGAS